jgi:glycerol-3-phosphate acyltransferase PlsY
MNQIIGVTLSFLSGSLPFSVWIGRWALGVDIRQVGDGNPGAANVWRAGGPRWGWLAIMADFSKGAIPVTLANFVFGWEGWALTAVAIAPVFGHAISPFLGFRGGKALAVTFGVWTGLTLWLGPLILGLAFAFWLALLKKEAWAVIAGATTQLATFLILGTGWVWFVVWVAIMVAFIWKHKTELVGK